MIKILNPKECGWNRMGFIFNTLLLSKWWHSTDNIEIETVIIIEDNTLYPSDTLRGLSNSITSTMLFGVIGTISAAAQKEFPLAENT